VPQRRVSYRSIVVSFVRFPLPRLLWLLFALILLWMIFRWVTPWFPPASQPSLALGPVAEWVAGDPLPEIVQVRSSDGKPLAGVSVALGLDRDERSVHTWPVRKSDESGLVSLEGLTVPADLVGPYRLIAASPDLQSENRTMTSVEIKRLERIYLSLDKTHYQPGETIRMRALRTRGIGRRPYPEGNLQFTVEDASGNLVMHEQVAVSESGLVWAEFAIATEVVPGKYTVSVKSPTATTRQPVMVGKRERPRIKLEVITPPRVEGGKVATRLRATYLNGQPAKVERAAVDLVSITSQPIIEVMNKGEFILKFPTYNLADSGLSEVQVWDAVGQYGMLRLPLRTDNAEKVRLQVLTRHQPEFWRPNSRLESGPPTLYMDRTNQVVLLSTDSDGRPMPGRVTWGTGEAAIGEAGVAEVTLPKGEMPLFFTFLGENGTTVRTRHLDGGEMLQALVQTSFVRSGETIPIELEGAAHFKRAWIYLLMEGEVIGLQPVELNEGRAQLRLRLPDEARGVVQVMPVVVGEEMSRDHIPVEYLREEDALLTP